MSDIGEKLKEMSKGKSKFLSDSKNRQKNKKWLEQSRLIAFSILEAMEEKNINKKELAEYLVIPSSKCDRIVQGKENLDIMTISKIETFLDINLIYVAKR